MRGRARRWFTVPVAVAVTAAGLVVGAGSAQAIGAVHFVNGGTAAPPTTLGPYTMAAFGSSDVRPEGDIVTVVPGPTGGVGLSVPMRHEKASHLYGQWGNGFTGDVYLADSPASTTVTLTLPFDTEAFYFYALPDYFGTFNITATSNNGTSSGAIPVTAALSGNAANYFGFYTDDGSSISSITVTVASAGHDIVVGEFGIASSTHAPAFTSPTTTTFTTGTSGSFDVTTLVDPAHGVAAVNCNACVLPDGVTFNYGVDGSATITGTPAPGTGGTYPLTITATNTLATTTQHFTLVVAQPPVLTGPTAPTYTVGASGTYTYSATGYPGTPTISISSGVLPTGLTLGAPVHTTNSHGDVTTTRTLSGTPAAGTGGTYPIGLVAGNGTLPDATLTVNVIVYEAPAITSADHATFTALQPNSFHVTAAGGYPSGPLTFSESGALPPGVTLTSSGLLSGNPPVAASGYWPITITASNGHAAATQSFTLFVHAPTVPARSMADPGGLTSQSLSADHECVTWTVTGYAPYAPVTVIGYPQTGPAVPFTLGSYDTNVSGRASLNLCLPSSARGTYTLLAAGYATSGTVRYQKAWTIVQP